MNKTIASLIFFFSITTIAFTEELEGNWINTNLKTRSYPKIEITKVGNEYNLVLWYIANKKNKRQAPIKLDLLGDFINDPNPTKYGYAEKEFDWATRRYILRRESDKLKLETLTIFKPISERPGPPMEDPRVSFRVIDVFQLESNLYEK